MLTQYADFRRLFAGNTVSLLGSSVTAVALPLTAAVVLDASPAEMGLLGTAGLLPQLVLGLPAGVWVDRMPYRRLLVVTDVVRAQVPRGAGPSLYGVNQQTFRQLLVSPELLSRANATWRFLVYGMQAFGALLGGLLGSALGLRGTPVVSSGAVLLGTALAWASPLRSSSAP